MSYPTDPSQPQQPGYPTAPPPGPGYPAPPGQGYPTAPPPGQGYPTAPPPGQGYPTAPPPGQGYPTAPPPGQGYPAPPGQGYQPAPALPSGYGYGQYGSPSIPPGMFIDPGSGLVLPQGTQLAGIGRRIGAYFLAIPLFIVTLGIGYIIWGLVAWSRGQSPALQVLGMRVWRPADGKPASWGYMALREIIGRLVDGILSFITEIISFVMMCTGKERKTLHDLVAGTVVLHDPNKVIPR